MAYPSPRHVQFRRGNTAAVSNYVGFPGEITVNIDDWTIRVCDGVTVGGHTATVNTATIVDSITNGNLTFGNIIPKANSVYSLGSITNQWQHLYVSSNTIYIGGTPLTITNGNLTIGGNVVQGGGGNVANLWNNGYTVSLNSVGNLTLPSGATLGDPYSDGGAGLQSAVSQYAVIASNNLQQYVQVDDIQVTMGTNYGNVSAKYWSFDKDGNLTLPSGGYLGNVWGEPSETTLTAAPGGFVAIANSSGDQYIDANDNNVQIGTNYRSGGGNVWLFYQNGWLVFPDDSVQTTAYSNAAVSTYLASYTNQTFGGNVTIQGNLTVNGNVNYISVNNVVIGDNIINLADLNPADSLDIGFVGHRTPAGRPLQHTGLVRSASANQWRLFSNVIPTPGTTVDFTNAIYDDFQVGNITSPTIDGINANVASANIGIKGYIDLANTIQSQQISAANVGIIGYIDRANTIQSGQVGAANLAITAANVGMKGYVDSLVYSNVQVASYLPTYTGNVGAGNVLVSTALRWSTGQARIILSGSSIQLTPDTGADALAGVLIGGNGYLLGPNGARNITLNYNSVGGAVGLQGNVTVGTASTSVLTVNGNVMASGNVTATRFIGDGSQLTGIPAGYSNVQTAAYLNATGYNLYSNVNVAAYLSTQGITAYSNVQVATYLPTYSGNVANIRLGVAGVLTFADGTTQTTAASGGGSSYSNVNVAAYLATATITTTGNITAGNLSSTYGLYVANITTTGSSGNISGANYITANVILTNGGWGNISQVANIQANAVLVSGNVTAQYFIGDGSQLTGLSIPVTYSNVNVKAYTESMGFTNFSNVNVAAFTSGLTNYSNVNTAAYLSGTSAVFAGNTNTLAAIQSNISQLFIGNSTALTSGGGAVNTSYSYLLHNLYYDAAGQLRYRNSTTTGAVWMQMTGTGVQISGQNSTVTANSVSNPALWAVISSSGITTYNTAGITSNGNLTTQTGGLVTTQTTGWLYNTFANVIYLGGAATVINAGAANVSLTVGSGTGNVTAGYFIGSGQFLTSLPGYAYSNVNVAAYMPGYLSTYSGNITAQNITVSGNINLTGNILQINSAVFYGNTVTGFNSLYAGIPGYTPVPQVVAQFTENYNGYAQINSQNINSGNQSSTDYIATANNGTDAVYFVDLGIAGSGYDPAVAANNNALGSVLSANDAYLYTAGNTATKTGGNLAIGVQTENKLVKIFAGGVNANNVVLTIANTGITTSNVTASYYLGSGQFLSALPGYAYSNVNVKAYTESMGFQNYANSNVASYLITNGYINSNSAYGNANTASYLITNGYVNTNSAYANSNVTAYTVTMGFTNFSNVNVAAYLNTQGYNLYSNVNLIAYLSSVQSLHANIKLGPSGNIVFADGTVQTTAGGGSYSNVQVATYLPTYSGNIANIRLGVSGVLTFADGTTMTTAAVGGGSSYSNVNVAAYLATGVSSNIVASTGAYFVGNLSATTTMQYSSGQGGLLFTKLVGGTGAAIYSLNVTPSAQNYALSTNGAALNLNAPTGGGVYTSINNTIVTSLTAGYLNVAGNVSAANVSAQYLFGDGSNLTNMYSNVNVTNYLPTHTGNVGINNLIGTSPNVTLVSNSYSTTYDIYGNVAFGNALYPVQVYATGNISTSGYLFGNGAFLTGIVASGGGGTNYSNVNVASYLGATQIAVANIKLNPSGNIIFADGTTQITAAVNNNFGNVNVAAYTAGLTNYSNVNTAAYLNSLGYNLYSNVNVGAYLAGNVSTGNLTVFGTAGGFVANITGVAAPGYGGSQTWQFFTQTNVGGGFGSWILFPDKSQQTTAYPGANTAGVTSLTLTGNVTAGGVVATQYGNSFGTTATYTGNVTVGNLTVSGNLSANLLSITANTITGTGANTTIIAGAYTSTFDNAGNVILPNVYVSGNVTAQYHIGSALGTTASYTGAVTTGNIQVNGFANITTASGNVDAQLVLMGNVSKGGSGYHDFLRITSTANSIQNPNKYFRLDNSGTLQILNSAYNSQIMTIADNGNTAVNGNLTVNGTGAITMPNRPAFRVYGSGVTSTQGVGNVNLKGSVLTVDYNQGNYFNSTTGQFIAPIAGLYNVTLVARVGTNNGLNQIAILRNGSNSGANVVCFWETDTNVGTASHFGTSGTVKLAVGEYLAANILAGNIQFDGNDSWTVTYLG